MRPYSKAPRQITPKMVVRGTLQRAPRAPAPKKRELPPVILSKDPLFAGTPYLKTLETMEQKPRMELTGVLGRVFNNKDVELLLFENQHQQEGAANTSAIEQLETCGFDREFLKALLEFENPEGVFFPFKVMEDDTWLVKIKAPVPDVLVNIRDGEAQYGYASDVLVRAVVVPRCWRMTQHDKTTCGFVLDIVQLEPIA